MKCDAIELKTAFVSPAAAVPPGGPDEPPELPGLLELVQAAAAEEISTIAALTPSSRLVVLRTVTFAPSGP
jgi:hypothetical protein